MPPFFNLLFYVKMKKTLFLITIIVLIVIAVLFFLRRKPDLETDFRRNAIELNHPQIIANDQNASEIKNCKNGIIIFNRQNATITILKNVSDEKKDTASVITLSETLRKELVIDVDNIGDDIYLFQPQKKRVFRMNIFKNIDSAISKTTFLYTRGTMIDKESFIVKESSDKLGLNDVFSVYKRSQDSRSELDSILPKLNDGGIGLDGFFTSDGSGKNIFVTYYTNEAFVFDNGKFIQSFAIIGGKKRAPEVVSKRPGLYSMKEIETAFSENGEIYQDHLYVLSNLLPKGNQKKGRYIDIYDIKTGKYRNSLFAPDYKGNSIKDFAVVDNLLIALYKDTFIQYKLQ